MKNVPEFIRIPLNRVDSEYVHTNGVEGYLFGGKDGSRAVLWTCTKNELSEEHVHEFDEYMIVIEGEYTIIVSGEETLLTSGNEYCIPKGVTHSGRIKEGTRIISIFGSKRTKRYVSKS